MRTKIMKLIGRDLVSLEPDDMLHAALRKMQAEKISCIPVLESGRPVGILTERGIVALLARASGQILKKPLKEVMSTPAITVSCDAYVYEALHLFVNHEIRHLVVIDEENLAVGVITLSDIINHVGSEIMVEFQTIDRYMSDVVFSIHKNDTLDNVLDIMANRAISCVIVSEDKVPIGMLTERDLIQFSTSGIDLENTRVHEVMSSPVVQIEATADVHEVTRTMQANRIRRVVVVNQAGQIKGLVTQTNIMRGLESNYIKILKQVIEEQDNRIESKTRELDDLSQYLMTILNSSLDMAIVATDRDFRVVYYNGCAEEILDSPSNIEVGKRADEIHELQGIEADRFEVIIDEVRKKGSYSFAFDRVVKEEKRHFQARINAIRSAKDKDQLGYVFMVQDITERKRAEENIRYMAYHDILTGLPNRVSFNERLELEFSHAVRKNQRLAVMVVDLDRFKQVNDTYGHFTGDMLLTEVATRLSDSLRRSDTVARVGGDEFMVLLPDIKRDEDVMKIGNKLIDAFEPPINLKGVDHFSNISLGIAFYPEHGSKMNVLVERADEAMYKAKKLGRKNGLSNLAVYTEAQSDVTPIF